MVTRTVPTDFPTIAAAAAASQPGDVIEVQAGYAGTELVAVSNLTINVAQAALGQIVLTLDGNEIALTAAGNGAVTLIGNAANNILTGNDGNNILRGEGGDDVLRGGGPAGNPLGVALNDYADYRNASGAVQVTLTDATAPGGPTGGFSTGADGNDTLENIENLIGSAHNDALTGNSFGNVLRGDGGDDTIDGGGGYDVALYNLATSGVTVTLTDAASGGQTGGSSSGADGNDTLISIEGITGSQHADTLTGNSGDNNLIGNEGNDILDGGAGFDQVFYGEVTGSLVVTLRDDGTGTATSSSGNDTLISIEAISGGNFDDTLTGNRFDNSFFGSRGNDTINGGAGTDTAIYFGNRSDYTVTQVRPGVYTVASVGPEATDTLTGIERLRFGDGTVENLTGPITRTVPSTDYPTIAAAAAASQPGDVIEVQAGYAGTEIVAVSNLTINVAQAALGQIVLTLDGNEIALTAAGNGAVTLIGNAANNILTGNDGNNILRGEAGNDVLRGGGPAGSPMGIGLNDYADYRNASGAVQVTLTDATAPGGPTGGFSSGADGNDTLENIENIIGSAHNDTLTGNSLGNALQARGGNDTLDGGAGIDFALYNLASGGVTVTLTDATTPGGPTGGTSSGADGNDTLINIESILGSQYADTLTGNSGDNGLNGGRGDDTLNGGAGIDTAFYGDATGAVSGTLNDDGTGTSSGADGNDTLTGIENISGSNFADTLTGNRFDNLLTGRLGNDTLNGGAGTDTAFYFGPRSNYTVTQVSPGTYTVTDNVGLDGTDTLTGIERLQFGGTIENIVGQVTRRVPTDFPTIAAAAAASQPGDAIDVEAGYAGTELVAVSDLTINVAQAALGQIVLTLDGNEIALTAAGNGAVTLIGNGANNVLTGNDGNNVLRGEAGDDVLRGGEPAGNPLRTALNDFADYRNASGAVQVTLTDAATPGGPTGGFSTGADGNDTLENIENLIGSAHNDTLTGNSLGNSLRGGGGNDTINGGAGFDIALYNVATGGVTVTLTDAVGGVTGGTSSGPDGIDTLINIEGITGSQHADTLTGNSGNNGLTGNGGDDIIDGGGGFDQVFYSEVTGALVVTLSDDGSGTATSSSGTDILINIEGISGGNFADTLTGNRFDNSFFGGGGNDTINGGAGTDTAVYFGPRTDYTVTQISPGTYTVASLGGEATDTLTGIERIQFGDGSVETLAQAPADGPGTTPNTSTPTTTTTEIGGVPVTTSVTTDANGNQTQVVTIPTISSTATEPVQVPIVTTSSGGPALTVAVPAGVGLTVSGPVTPTSGEASTTAFTAQAGSEVDSAILEGGKAFIAGLPANTQVVVQAIVPTIAPGASAPSAPIVISGASGTGATSVLIIDTSNLPSGTVLQLQNVSFAAIVGNITISGGEGSQTVYADGGNQIIVLGADDDVLYGGAGDDTVGSATGNDKLFGEEGNDLLFGGAGDDELDGGIGSDTASFSGNRSEYRISQQGSSLLVEDLKPNRDGTDIITNFEFIKFADQTIAAAADLPFATLFATNIAQGQGFAAAYQFLLGGIPSESGFDFLIKNNLATNFGAGPGPVFNAENIIINIVNALVQGNPSASGTFSSIASGNSLSEKIASIYGSTIPTSQQNADGLAFMTRAEALVFFEGVAAERGIASTDGAAIVALASLLKIAIDGKVGVGNGVSDLTAAIAAGSAALPASSTTLISLEVADGVQFDADDSVYAVPPISLIGSGEPSVMPSDQLH